MYAPRVPWGLWHTVPTATEGLNGFVVRDKGFERRVAIVILKGLALPDLGDITKLLRPRFSNEVKRALLSVGDP